MLEGMYIWKPLASRRGRFPATLCWTRTITGLRMGPVLGNVQCLESGETTVLRYRWSINEGIFLAFVAIYWISVIFASFLSGLISGQWAYSFVTAIFLAVGIYLAYEAVAFLFNTTYVCVSKGRVEVNVHPIPWPGHKIFPASTIHQAYVRQIEEPTDGDNYRYFEVWLKDKMDKDHRLLSRVRSAPEGLFIKWTIENKLGITDRRMSGELCRVGIAHHNRRISIDETFEGLTCGSWVGHSGFTSIRQNPRGGTWGFHRHPNSRGISRREWKNEVSFSHSNIGLTWPNHALQPTPWIAVAFPSPLVQRG